MAATALPTEFDDTIGELQAMARSAAGEQQVSTAEVITKFIELTNAAKGMTEGRTETATTEVKAQIMEEKERELDRTRRVHADELERMQDAFDKELERKTAKDEMGTKKEDDGAAGRGRRPTWSSMRSASR